MSMRSVYCGDVGEAQLEKEVVLCGWVNRRRDLGGLIFIDMRDKAGIVQVYFDPDQKETHELAATLRNECCIKVTGIVKARPDNQINKNMKTGKVEVMATGLEIINRSEPLPLDSNQDNTEEQRLKFRYIDLRRPDSLMLKLRCSPRQLLKAPVTIWFQAVSITASSMHFLSLRSFSSSF